MHDVLKADLIPAAALESHIGILGKTGSGKSNLAKVLAERLMKAGERVCAVDPTGTWWGLRLAEDGKRPSLFSPIVFGGDHGDMPLAEQHGAVLAEAIGTSKDSAIIDTQQMTVGQRTRFFTDFAEALLRYNRGPLHLIIDEAHIFAPQGGAKQQGGAMPAMLHAANNLVSLGRGRGLRITLISQRPAKLHKDSLTQVETLIAMRLIAPQDVKAVREWIGEWADPAKGAEIIKSLPSLPKGDAWVWSPQIDHLERRHFPLAATFDSGRPEANATARDLPAIDLAKIGAKMDTIRQEAQANDPKRLKARIAELEKAKPSTVTVPAAPDPKLLEAAETRGYERGVEVGKAAGLTEAKQRLQALADALPSAVVTVAARPAPVPRQSAPKVAAAAVKREAPPAREPVQSDGTLTGPQETILRAMAWWKNMGHDAPLRPQIAAICGWKATSSHLKNRLSELSTKGLVTYPSAARVSMTPEGAAVAPEPDTGMTVVAGVRAALSGPQASIFDVLLPNGAATVTRDSIADALGWDRGSSHLKNRLSELSTLQVVTYPDKGQVALSDWIFD